MAKYLGTLTSKQNSIWWEWAFEHRFKMTFMVEPYQFSFIFWTITFSAPSFSSYHNYNGLKGFLKEQKCDCPKDERKLIRLDHKCHIKSMFECPFPSYRNLFWCKSTKIFCPGLVILSLINFLSSFGQSRFLIPPSLLHIMQWVEMVFEEAFSTFLHLSFNDIVLYAVNKVIIIKSCVWPFLW